MKYYIENRTHLMKRTDAWSNMIMAIFTDEQLARHVCDLLNKEAAQ